MLTNAYEDIQSQSTYKKSKTTRQLYFTHKLPDTKITTDLKIDYLYELSFEDLPQWIKSFNRAAKTCKWDEITI